MKYTLLNGVRRILRARSKSNGVRIIFTHLDIEAARLGVPRQAIIKFILDEKLKKAI